VESYVVLLPVGRGLRLSYVVAVDVLDDLLHGSCLKVFYLIAFVVPAVLAPKRVHVEVAFS